MNMIDARQFAALMNAGAVKAVAVQGTAGGFVITADGVLIEAKRGNPRIFRKLHTVATFLRGHGVGSFSVDLSRWNPDQQAL